MKKLPFRQKQLLTTRDFIHYCADNGLRIDEPKLEELHKDKLLVPVVKLYLGVVPYKKIYQSFGTDKVDKSSSPLKEWRFISADDLNKFKPEKINPKTYFLNGSLFRQGDDWLSWYTKHHLVEYPSIQRFKPWDKKVYDQDYTTKRKSIEKFYVFLYEKYQLLILKDIISLQNTYQDFSDNLTKILNKKVKRFDAFIDFYISAEKLFNNWLYTRKVESASINKAVNNNTSYAKDDWRKKFAEDFSPMLKKSVQSLINKHGLTLDDIDNWQRNIASKTFFGESNKSYSLQITKNYLRNQTDSILSNTEDLNYMIYILNQIFFFATGEIKSIRQILGDSKGVRCVICHRLFKKKKVNQYTCGNKECVNAYKNQLKQKARRIKKMTR